MKTIIVKCESVFMDDLVLGTKNFEVRYNDRDYCPNDVLMLVEVGPDHREIRDRVIIATISYVLIAKNCAGLEPNYCVLGLKDMEIRKLERV